MIPERNMRKANTPMFLHPSKHGPVTSTGSGLVAVAAAHEQFGYIMAPGGPSGYKKARTI